jgi:hypothetical protein
VTELGGDQPLSLGPFAVAVATLKH